MGPPQNLDEYLKFIAVETARMGWPGSMMRGEKHVLKKGAKQATERFFRDRFPMRSLWDDPLGVADDYERWHRRICCDLADVLGTFMGAKHNKPETVAAKLLDTFMHQLMKTSRFRVLWPKLHLPLDSRVFAALRRRRVDFDGKAQIVEILREGWPYSINRDQYDRIQESLQGLLAQMPSYPSDGLQWSSRIELNWLWI